MNSDNKFNSDENKSLDVESTLSDSENSNKEYLNVLEKIKNKVERENSNKNNDTLEDTVVLNTNDIKEVLANNPKVNFEENVSSNLVNNKVNYNNEFINKQNEEFTKKPVLEVLGLRKKIKLKTIVEDITFDMREGEIIGLLGPNGSGKTTIMRMLVGLTKATKGEVYCFEKPLGLGHTKMLSEVGAMIESPEFYNYLSGYSNLKQLARLSGKSISRAKIKELLKFVGLDKVARRKVKTYSLGMRQRLGLAQALLHDPKILILDEPVNGLDPQGVQDFRNKLKEIASTGVSILISSHLLDEIEKVSDRIIVLEKGRIIYDDTLDKLRSEDTEKTLINTYDNDRAELLIKDLDISYNLTQDGFLFENLSKEEKSRLVSYLVNSHVEIDTIKIVVKTLEERFLEITGKGEK